MDAVRAHGYVFRNEIMPFELFAKIAGDFVGRCRSFGISCGYEPLLNKEFDRYVAHAVGLGLPDVHFYTNGTLMTEDMAHRLVEAGPSRIVFSLEGADAETFVDIRRGATLEKFLGAIDMINAAKKTAGRDLPRVRLNWVLMPRNIDQLPNLLELARAHECAEIYLIPHVRWRDADLQEPSLVADHLEQRAHAIADFKTDAAAAGISVIDETLMPTLPPEATGAPTPAREIDTPQPRRGWRALVQRILGSPASVAAPAAPLPYCLQPWEMIIVTSAGTIMPCTGVLLDRVYGDFKTATLAEIWSSDAYRELRAGLTNQGAPCGHCEQCPHFSLNRRDEEFHKPRDIDVDRLRALLPSITPKREKVEAG